MFRKTIILAALLLATGCACELDARTAALNARIDRAWQAMDASAQAAQASGDAEAVARTRRLAASLRGAQETGRAARAHASRDHYEQAERTVDEIEAALGTR